MNELAAIYNFYVVTHVKVRFEVSANEPALPVFFGYIFRDTQPSTIITTFPLARDALEVAPTTGMFLIGETTGSSVFRSKWYKIRPDEVIGNPLSYYGNYNYSAAVGSNPAQLIWGTFILTSYQNATLLTNGAFLNLNLVMTTKFYQTEVAYV